MFWSLVRIGSPRTLTTACPSRSHSVRLSGVLRLLSNGISFNNSFGPQRRNICSTCSRKCDLPNRLSRGRDTLLPTSGVFYKGRKRLVGTSTDYNSSSTFHERNKTTAIYVIALAVAVMGFSYLAVPLYRLFCQVLFSNVKGLKGIVLGGNIFSFISCDGLFLHDSCAGSWATEMLCFVLPNWNLFMSISGWGAK
mgnify:CR=1 FL=1